VAVFVYGTLMRGQTNAHLMRGAVCRGRVVTAPDWSLVSLGPWPAMIPGDARVSGELYEVSAVELPALDAFEDVPDLYERIAITLDDGRTAQAWVMPARRAVRGVVIPGGDWRDVIPTTGPARVVYDRIRPA
jgi:gamma-glutamylcyclotransferase (GGCT)/AIG2-like uncharacterized protein YtfP